MRTTPDTDAVPSLVSCTRPDQIVSRNPSLVVTDRGREDALPTAATPNTIDLQPTQKGERPGGAKHSKYHYHRRQGLLEQKVCSRVSEKPLSSWLWSGVTKHRATRTGVSDNSRVKARVDRNDICRPSLRPRTGPRPRAPILQKILSRDIEHTEHGQHDPDPGRHSAWQYLHEEARQGGDFVPGKSRALRSGYLISRKNAGRSSSGRGCIQSASERDKYLIMDQDCLNSRQVKIEAQLDGGADKVANLGKGHSVNVADRIKAYETKALLGSSSTAERNKAPTAGEQVPLVFPLHVRRFTRRSKQGGSLRPESPETPFFQSIPADDAEVYSPLPQRTIPIVKSPAEDSAARSASASVDTLEVTLDATRVAAEYPKSAGASSNRDGSNRTNVPSALQNYRVNAAEWTKHEEQSAQTPSGTSSHLHGRRDSCVRHGRKPSSFKGIEPLYNNARSGGYASAGLEEPRQVDATSPYLAHNLSRYPGWKTTDACPDCLAELGIRRRETAPIRSTQHAAAPPERNVQSTSVMEGPGGSDAIGYATEDMPMLPVLEERLSCEGTDPTIGSLSEADMPNFDYARLARSKGVRFQSRSPSRVTDNAADSDYTNSHIGVENLVISSDLGDGLDAVILERGGRLERVVMNLRRGTPTVAALQRLSRELWQVADALQAAATEKQALADGSGSQSEYSQDVSDLLYHINEATGAGVDLGIMRTTEMSVTFESRNHTPTSPCDPNTRQTIPTLQVDFDQLDTNHATSERSQPSPATRIANRQSIDADFAALRLHFGHDSSDHEEAESRLIRASQDVPAYLATSTTLPNRGGFKSNVPDITITDDNHDGQPTLPSHILKAQDMATSTLAHDAEHGLGPESPPMFSHSTGPSRAASSTQPSPTRAASIPVAPVRHVDTWQDLTQATAPSVEHIPIQQDSTNPDRDVIRKAMRMNGNKAVQEAAASERHARRQRQIDAQTKAAGMK